MSCQSLRRVGEADDDVEVVPGFLLRTLRPCRTLMVDICLCICCALALRPLKWQGMLSSRSGPDHELQLHVLLLTKHATLLPVQICAIYNVLSSGVWGPPARQ